MADIGTVGGGNGSQVVNEALLRAGVKEITTIAAVFDSGGATGRRRLDSHGQEIAYSDPMRALLSLIDIPQQKKAEYQAIKTILNHRDDRDRVLGQELFHHFFDNQGFSRIEELLTSLGIILRGEVVPASIDPTYIAFRTISGRKFRGDHLLDEQRMSKDMIDTIWLDPEVSAYAGAVQAIENARMVILCCGSLYGSVLENFLPAGMQAAMRTSQAKLWLVTNLVSTRNETHRFTPSDFVTLVEKYVGKRPDGLIVPEISRDEFDMSYPNIAKLYALEHSYFLGWKENDLNEAKKKGIKVERHKATTVIQGSHGSPIVRHDPQLLADILKRIISSDRA